MQLDKGVNELNQTTRTNRATQVAGRKLLRCYTAAGTEPITADAVWFSAVIKYPVLRAACLRDVTLSQAQLQLLRQPHLAAHTLPAASRGLSQSVSAFWAMKCHGANAAERLRLGTPEPMELAWPATMADQPSSPSLPFRMAERAGERWCHASSTSPNIPSPGSGVLRLRHSHRRPRRMQ